jgi:2-C-methyl-D-erythritol 4-phosphate cytidylyltransferase
MGADALATAVIAAAGSGDRLGAGGPKALVEVAGEPLLAWSLAALADSDLIGGVVIAAPPGHEEAVLEVAGDATVVLGGASRSESVANALKEVESELVVVHDAARPVAPPRLFDAIVAELAADPECDALIAAVPVADTVKRALAGRVIDTVPRSELWAVQTPQAFRTSALRSALDADAETLAGATDDASLVESGGGVVRIFRWDEPNLKVTTRSDLTIAEALLLNRPKD